MTIIIRAQCKNGLEWEIPLVTQLKIQHEGGVEVTLPPTKVRRLRVAVLKIVVIYCYKHERKRKCIEWYYSYFFGIKYCLL